jgi:pyrroloquinoline-quinone synthase
VNFWTRLEQISEQRSVLRHPFYVRWNEGALTREELGRYSGQYRHAVLALAAASAAAARSPEAGADASTLAAHAREEADHVELWDEFVAQVGGDVAAEANAYTRACADTWVGDDTRPLMNTLVAMYAVESAQPAISATKLAGLAQHYGIVSSPYFELHQHLDLEHAAQSRAIIDRRLVPGEEDGLLVTAEQVLDANRRLLDGV